MKNSFKYLAAGVSMACAVGSATAEETAFEGQPIGSIPVTSTTTNTIVAVAFRELSPVDGQGVSVSNILSTVNLVAGDKVFVLSGGKYHGWTLNASKFWEADAQTYTIGAGGGTQQGTGAQSDTLRPDIGQGFWLQRKGARSGAMPDTFYIFGAAVNTNATVAAHGVKSLLGNPKRAQATLTTTNANLKDTISLIASNGALMREYKYVSIGGVAQWGELSLDTGLIPKYKAATITIPSGVGFWYNSTGLTDVTLNWADQAQ